MPSEVLESTRPGLGLQELLDERRDPAQSDSDAEAASDGRELAQRGFRFRSAGFRVQGLGV